MENAHAHSPQEVLQFFNVDPKVGLRKQQVEENRARYGPNELPPEEGTPFWKLIIKQFEDLLVRILLGAAIISFVLALFEEGDDKAKAFVEPIVILLILIANAAVGVWQDKNAENAIEALKAYEAPTAVVLRDGELVQIAAIDLVPGDIIDVAASPGKDLIPGDSRLLELYSTTLRIDQSPLTGESEAVMKYVDTVALDADTIDKQNILFSGTTIVYGRGRAIVTLTGKRTKIGQIYKDVTEEEDADTPLKKKLDEFGEQLSKVIFVICILVWVVNIGHFTDPEHGNFVRGAIYYFKIAVALAVAAIPEGLPAVVTTCLALGTRKMAEKNAIVRELPSVETLGCTTVICSDKTGTLTTNMMSVAKVLTVASGESHSELLEYDVEDTRFEPDGAIRDTSGRVVENPVNEVALARIAEISAQCNDSSLRFNDATGKVERSGEATEAALRVLVEKIGIADAAQDARRKATPVKNRFDASNKYWEGLRKKIQTLEFSRDRKSMSAYCEGNLLFVKGAPENILARSTKVQLNDGSVVTLTERLRERIQEKVLEYGTGVKTLRCLGLAYRDNFDGSRADFSDPHRFGEYEQNLTFVGIVGMLDPPRAEVQAAIDTCKQAGIRVIVITGDNKATAESICRRIGVFEADEDLRGKSFTGKEFDALSENQKHDAVRNASLFCRVEPSHKMRLVELLQDQGEIVAMTGDGVNDAPALKKANIGVAMGSGTAVARESSKMVLKDDNFATIVSAVQEGRAIFNNTKQFIRYLISSNIGEVVCIFLTAALGMPEALVPVQLLWVNLVTDGLPATALGFNPPEPDIMKKAPRSSNEPIVNGWMFTRYLIIGIYVGLATVGGFAYWYLFYSAGPQLSWYDLTHFNKCVEGSHSYSCSIFHDQRPSTISLSVLVTIEMFNALNAVSENDSILRLAPWTNPWLIGAIILSFSLHFAILYIPFLSALFGVTAINWDEWMIVLAFSLPIIAIDETLKFVSRNFFLKDSAAAQKKHR